MEIRLARAMGMCKGLRLIMHRTERTLQRARAAPTPVPVYIFRDLVHNKQAHQELLKMGAAGQVHSVDALPHGSRVIVGPHSAPPSTLAEISKRATLVDTSCYDVLKVPKMAKTLANEGCRILFAGRPDHEEAEMILKEHANAMVISDEKEVTTLPTTDKFGLVSQSTFTQAKLQRIVDAIRSSGRNLVVANTVCNETHQRQLAATELAKSSTKMLVIGGKKSNNTGFLRETCAQYSTTYQVEDADEILATWFTADDRAGVTAGASTPDAVIQRCVARLQSIAAEQTTAGSGTKLLNRVRVTKAEMSRSAVHAALGGVEWFKQLSRITKE